jgi:hypothetical protein
MLFCPQSFAQPVKCDPPPDEPPMFKVDWLHVQTASGHAHEAV